MHGHQYNAVADRALAKFGPVFAERFCYDHGSFPSYYAGESELPNSSCRFGLYCLAFFIPLALGACAQPVKEQKATTLEIGQNLTLEAIFKDKEFDAEKPGQIRWLEDGSGYTTIEIVEEYKDVDPEEDEDGEEVPWPEEIVFYDPETLKRSVLISARQLTPENKEQALTIDDYHWSTQSEK